MVEAIAAQFPVEDDRGVQAVLEVREIALERRPRHAEPLQQLLAGDEPAPAQHLVDLVDPFHFAHAHLRRYRQRTRAQCVSPDFRIITQGGQEENAYAMRRGRFGNPRR